MNETINDFKNWLVSQRKSLATVEAYTSHLKRLAVWGEAQHPAIRQAVDFKARDLTRFIAERQLMDGIGATSVQVTISAFRKFFRWIVGASRSPARTLVFPRAEISEQRTLSPDQARRVLEAPDTSSTIGRRDLAILCLMLDTGLRASEVANLTLEGVHLDELYLVVRGKRGKMLAKAFCHYTAIQMSNWLAERKAVEGCDRFFVSVLHGSGYSAPPGKALTRQAIRALCKRVSKVVGLKELSPHDFRRTCTYIAMLRGCPDRIAELQLGWGESARGMLTRYSLALRAKHFLDYSPVAWLMSGAYAKEGQGGELNT